MSAATVRTHNNVRISDFLGRNFSSSISVWPLNDCADAQAELEGRLTLGIHTGNAVLHLHPTRDEAIALIDALKDAVEWPLQVVA